MLHPYGRYCNAFKFAGEIDVLEAIEDVCRRYRIDRDRIAVRGFSMGGAAAWHFSVHYADRWAAANPGAGFAESARYLKLLRDGQPPIPEYERKLWHLYDATDYAANLRHCPTVAYSGEIDPQKQAADVMADALSANGIELKHVIGPGTKHSYHPAAAKEVDDAIASIASRGRERMPQKVSLTTYTLKYNHMNWLTVDGLDEHWQRARVEAALADSLVDITQAENVAALTLSMPAGWAPFDVAQPVTIRISGSELAGPRPLTDRSWSCSLHKAVGQWRLGPPPEVPLRKRRDLQGPIDDAFMDSFVFAPPTGTARHSAVEKWVRAEFDRAVDQWRRQFRGRVRIVDDTAVDDEAIKAANLVLWGDPASNTVLRRIADRLPIKWGAAAVRVGAAQYPAEHHALVMIYPNPHKNTRCYAGATVNVKRGELRMRIPQSLRWKVDGDTLGRGGQGAVTVVGDDNGEYSGQYALKALEGGKPRTAYERFAREIEALHSVEAPGVVTVIDHSAPEDQFQFYVMEYVEGGKSLKKLLDIGKNPFRADPLASLDFFIKLVSTIEAYDATGIIHRDLSPANVLVLPDGNIRVIDFGLCQIDGAETITLTGEGLGTPNYMAPECESGAEGAVTVQADLYSAGKILWDAIANTTAFAREAAAFNAKSTTKTFPDDPSAWHLHHVFEKTIRHSPSKRAKNPSGAIELAKRVRHLVLAGYMPFEHTLKVCPQCGLGTPKPMEDAYRVFHNPVPERYAARKCQRCGYCYIVDLDTIRAEGERRVHLA